MIPIERIEIALKGGMPDKIPTLPIYDTGYVASSIGRGDIREFITTSPSERSDFIEKNFLRHKVDGLVIHRGCNDNWSETHDYVVYNDYWLVTDIKSGERYRMISNGGRLAEDGSQYAPKTKQESKITCSKDIRKFVPVPMTEKQMQASGFFCPLRNLSSKYTGHHFSFQARTPIIGALNACGGYIEGLTTLIDNRRLFTELLEAFLYVELALLLPAKKSGAKSVWLTSYYTGPDTISPKDYKELIFPLEVKLCEAAKRIGLSVIYWFLGDLIPILNVVRELPIDAIMLEQGRKGYEIDPVKIRSIVGEKLCIGGFGYEQDYCSFNRNNLTVEIERQIAGAGKLGAFIAGTPILTSATNPDAVDYYFDEVERIGSKYYEIQR